MVGATQSLASIKNSNSFGCCSVEPKGSASYRLTMPPATPAGRTGVPLRRQPGRDSELKGESAPIGSGVIRNLSLEAPG